MQSMEKSSYRRREIFPEKVLEKDAVQLLLLFLLETLRLSKTRKNFAFDVLEAVTMISFEP